MTEANAGRDVEKTLEMEPVIQVHDFNQPESQSAEYAGFLITAGVFSCGRTEKNEDSHYIDAKRGTFGIFDGVGSQANSAFASGLAAKYMHAKLRPISVSAHSNLAEHVIKRMLSQVHDEILENELGVPGATTATVGKIFKDKDGGSPYISVGQVGDSRAYLIRAGQISFITYDQAASHLHHGYTNEEAQDILASAKSLDDIPEGLKLAYKHRNTITGALGYAGGHQIDTYTVPLEVGDRLIFTSDGVHDNLMTEEIGNIARKHTGDVDLATSLVMRAVKRGRGDDPHFRSKRDDTTAISVTLKG